MDKKTKNIITGVVVAALLVGAYFAFFKGGDSDDADLLRVSGNSLSATGSFEAEILSLLRTLRSISFDTTIFEDPEFQSLSDFSIELVPQPQGRPNPFAPIGSDPIEEFDETDEGDISEDELDELLGDLEDDLGLDEFDDF